MSYVPVNKGQFTLDTQERSEKFEENRGAGSTESYAENRKQWWEYPKSQTIPEYPLHVDLELASICNLRCPMCYTISSDFKRRVNTTLMTLELFKRLVDECAAGGVYSIRLSFRGEAFLHPDIVECIRYAKEKGIKEVSTLTNGVRIDEDMFTEIMNLGIDWITFSIDGVGEVYEKIRRPAKFDRVVEKLTNFAKIKKAAGKVKPVVKVQTIYPAISDNPDEFYEVFAPISDLVSSNPLQEAVTEDAMRHLPKVPEFVCPQLYQRLVIGADGLAMMCTNDRKSENIVGDVNKSTIHDIWHGEEMNRHREIHQAFMGPEQVEACSKCYYPLVTVPEDVTVQGRNVPFEKYLEGTDKVSDLDTPKRWKRDDLNV